MLSMRNSQFFSSCLALSAAIFTDEEIFANNMYDRYFGNVFGPKPVNGVINDYWKAHNPLHLLDRIDKKLLKSVHFYIDRGDDDFLYKGNSALHVKMRDLEIPHEYRVKDGAHNWSYWRTSLFDGLIFISDKFRL